MPFHYTHVKKKIQNHNFLDLWGQVGSKSNITNITKNFKMRFPGAVMQWNWTIVNSGQSTQWCKKAPHHLITSLVLLLTNCLLWRFFCPLLASVSLSLYWRGHWKPLGKRSRNWNQGPGNKTGYQREKEQMLLLAGTTASMAEVENSRYFP